MVERKTQLLKSAFLRCLPIFHRPYVSFLLHGVSPNQSNRALELDISFSNRIITGFARSGDIASAREVFDKMVQRDVVSWNSMISGYSYNGMYDEALRTFSEMRKYGMRPSQTSFSIVLASCVRLGALAHGEWIHGLTIKSGSSVNEFVGTSLIVMYSECNLPDCLMKVFNDFGHGNVESWNALISGFVLNGRIGDAREVFDQMEKQNVVSWTAMISGYVGIKKVRNALELFNLMPAKNSVSWSVMLGGFVSAGQFEEALDFFGNMLGSGIQVSLASMLKVIGACSGLKDPKQGRKIHGYVLKSGFYFHPGIGASLIAMYFRCMNSEEAKSEFERMHDKSIGSWNSLICGYIDNDRVDEARKWFNKMRERDEISWNSMINGYLREDRIEDSLELFSLMPKPVIQTYTALLSGFIENGKIYEAQQLFNKMPERDVMAYTTMLFGHMEVGSLQDALDLFENMPVRNVVAYNIMISGLARHGKVKEAYVLFNESPERDAISWYGLTIGLVHSGFNEEAFRLFHKMILSGVTPNGSVIASLLSASATLSLLSNGELIHGTAIKYGYELCLVVANSLVNMYAKCGNMSIAKFIFDRMDERDLVTWNAMIYGYAVNGFGMEAIEMFEEMKVTEIKPDGITFLGVLSACAHKCLLEEAQYYFDTIRSEHSIAPNLMHYTCIIGLVCRMGLVEKAERLISSMPFEPDSIIWTSVLHGCQMNYNVSLAEHAAKQLFMLVPGDPNPYLHLSRIYRSAGRWTDYEELRNQMSKLGISKRPGCSWIEINGRISSFFAGDKSQSVSADVLPYLRGVIHEIKKLGYVPDYSIVIEDMEDQEKEEVLMMHSEKIAVAFGLLKMANPKPIRVIKNLRICGDCHMAMKLISLYSKREIVVRDNVRFHHFKGGSCSCSDYW